MLHPMVNVLPCAENPSDVILTNHCTSRNLFELVYGLLQLKYVTLIFTIPNMFEWIYTKSKTYTYETISMNIACSLLLKIFVISSVLTPSSYRKT